MRAWSGANLNGARLDRIEKDLVNRLSRVPTEVHGLLAALAAGRIDGSAYEGDCACFVGTVAKLRGCHYSRVANLAPDSESLTEKWFLAIRTGDTPDNHPVAAIVRDWIVEWMAERGTGPLIEAVSEVP